MLAGMGRGLGEEAGDPSALRVGQLRRQTMLDSDAVYRIVRLSPALVEVSVVRAPGLAAGETFVFSRGAVLAMELLVEPTPP